MYKKLVCSILVVAFLNLMACSSTQTFTVSEYRTLHEKEEKPDDIPNIIILCVLCGFNSS